MFATLLTLCKKYCRVAKLFIVNSIDLERNDMTQTLVVTGKRPYQVHKQLAGTDSYRLYEVRTEGVKTPFVLKIAADAIRNGVLDREAFLLSRMREHALTLEAQYQARYPGKYLNYQFAFPSLQETFVVEEQGGRRVLILEIETVDQLEKLVPLSMIRTRDCVRVDHKTSAWILGKSLKILAFAHDYGVSYGEISGDDIVVERDSHLVLFFDWTQAIKVSGGGNLTRESIHREMYLLAGEIAKVLGGDPVTLVIPTSEDDPDGQLQRFLLTLSQGGFNSASKAHKHFYQMVEAMWGRKFHPYTTFPV